MATSILTKYLAFLLFVILAFSSKTRGFPPPSGTNPDAGMHRGGTDNLLHGRKGPLLCKPLYCHTPGGFCGVTLINFEPQPCSHGYQNKD